MKIYFTFFIMTLCSITKGQSDSAEKEKPSLKGTVQFISNQSYAGRTDSFNIPVLVPALNFHTPAGFFAEAKGYYNLSASNSSFDGISIQLGYEFSPQHWNGEISLIK